MDELGCNTPLIVMVGRSQKSPPQGQFFGILNNCKYIDETSHGELHFLCTCLESECDFLAIYVPSNQLENGDIQLCHVVIL